MAGETINIQRFIPKFIANFFAGRGIFNNSYLLGQRGPIWLSVTEPRQLYESIPELKAVIDRDATMFSNMKIYKRDKKTKKPIEDPLLDLLLDNPNCTQGQNQFLRQYRSQYKTYGNQFMYKNVVRSSAYPVALWNVSSFYIQPVLTGKLFDQTSMSDIIGSYKMINALNLDNFKYSKNFDPATILFTRIPDLDNPIVGRSPLMSLQYPLSNIETSYKASNVAMQHVGVGIISPENNKDMAGSLPLNPKDRKDMEEQFGKDYGIEIGQRRTVLANSAVKFSSMAVETNKLLLKQEIDADMIAICNVLNMNPQIFLTNTTYENLRAGIVQTYQDNIIPAADEFMQALGPFIGLKENEELIASFEHLSILKENKLKGMQAIESIVKSLSQAVEMKLIDAKQATDILATELGLNAASF